MRGRLLALDKVDSCFFTPQHSFCSLIFKDIFIVACFLAKESLKFPCLSLQYVRKLIILMKKKLQTVTLGCSKNKVDTEHILSQVEDQYEIIPEGEDIPVDVILLNTCKGGISAGPP